MLFVVLELTTNMLLEPIFYGNTAGVSEVAFFSFVHQKKPDLICIGALPPAALSRSQHLKAGLQNEYPDEQIVIGQWGLSGSTNRKLLRTMGVEYVGTTLADTRLRLISAVQLLLAQRGIISQSSSDRQSPSAAQLVT